jgi:hypothetical protein
MSPPSMAGWNLGLRFGLELGALAALATATWRLAPGTFRWVAVVIVPVIAAAIWGVFNVLGDPSRSGAAPVEVGGWTRLAIELLILGGGAVALGLIGQPVIGIGFAVLIAAQYVTSWSRVQWLVEV